MKVYQQSFQYGEHEVTIETGAVARQATGSVIVRCKDTVILVTAVAKKEAKEGAGFFPLTINYQERMYAAGRIPGGFLKREGRPSDKETLISRLIDRPIRPLFPEGFRNEVQVVANVISLDPSVKPDVLAMIGASAALALSGAPFMGPISAARIGYKDGHYLLNPDSEQLESSQLDLVVAGTEQAVLMVESEADELPEDVMLGAVLYGHEQMQVAIKAINDLVAAAGKAKWQAASKEIDAELLAKVEAIAAKSLEQAYQIKEKQERYDKLDAIKAELEQQLVGASEEAPAAADVLAAFAKLEKDFVRQSIINGNLRIDGRDTRTVRPIHVKSRWLPRPHGSALFTRGETQAIVTATLGTESDAQILDAVAGESRDRFMLHYNFPPYCVGETGMMGTPKRREIGHGNLARRAISSVLPDQERFPYTMRVVSEITESNGSSSMATVCGTSLALMDAGVPIKAPVAGIAMGLIKEGDKFAVLSDILGDEDHLGDMDFKVAGTSDGVTALQMDIKIQGITQEIMEKALEQAKEGRLHILGIMKEDLAEPNKELSPHAPRIFTMKINPDKIRDVIGKGGATIKALTEGKDLNIDLDDQGNIKIFAASGHEAKEAIEKIENLVAEAEIGSIYQGKVTRLEDYGAFVNILPGKDGLLHISQVKEERIENIKDHISIGETLKVKVLDIDKFGRIKLSRRDMEQVDAEGDGSTVEAVAVEEDEQGEVVVGKTASSGDSSSAKESTESTKSSKK